MRGWSGLVGLWIMWPFATAMAQGSGLDPHLERIRQLVVHAEYAEAEAEAEALLERTDLRSHHRIGALEALAIVRIAERDEQAALEILRRLYALDPNHTITDLDVSPVVLSMFARARAHPPDPVTVRMEHEPARHAVYGSAWPVQVRITEGADAVETVVIAYRLGSERSETRLVLPVGADGTVRGVISLGWGEQRVRYHIQALAPSGAPLGRIGSIDDPVEIRTPPLQPQGTGGLPHAAGTAASDAGRFRLVEQWWFWSIVGVTVVGMTAGIAVGASNSDEDRPATTLGSGRLQ